MKMQKAKPAFLTSRAKVFSNAGGIWVVANFVFMFSYMIYNGAVAFPCGVRTDLGCFVEDHGTQYEFTRLAFEISYWQGLVTFVSFPIYLFGILIFHAMGEVKGIWASIPES